MSEPWQPDEAMTAFIELDHDRARRRGYPEAVYCEGKTPSQVRAVAEAVIYLPVGALIVVAAQRGRGPGNNSNQEGP